MSITIRDGGYTYRDGRGEVWAFGWHEEDDNTFSLIDKDGLNNWFHSNGRCLGSHREFDLIEEIPPVSPPSPPLGSIKVVERMVKDIEVTPGPLWEGARVELAGIESGRAIITTGVGCKVHTHLPAPDLRKFASALTALADGMEAQTPPGIARTANEQEGK